MQLRIRPAFLIFMLAFVMAGCQQQSAESPEAAEPAANPAAETTLPAGITLLETFDGEGSEYAIPYAKYRLANGLTVVLHEDHSDPLVHVDITYHVGSNREEPGRSGFAHFFEHMMFQGSENVGDEEHFKIVSNAGGTLNGSTNTDRTNYYQTVPVNQLETVLWLEADRMGVFLDAVTQEKFEVQRETVKNERGQNYDNRPYGTARETIMKSLYPDGHPYSWPTIGWLEDLDRADLTDLKRFFLRWYGPNNAALTIGGAIDPMVTLELVNKYFGPIPAGPEVEDLPKQPASLEADRYVTLEDNIHLPAIGLAMPTVYRHHPDEAPLDAAARILGQGQASLLYQRLVQTGRAVQASVSHGCRELACELFFIVVQNPSSGESLADMEQAVRETIAEFAERPVSEDDLQKFKAGIESGRVFALQSVSGKVTSLAAYETFTGSPQGLADEIERYLAVTRDDVTRVFNEYINNKPSVILSIVPNGQPQLAAAEQNYDAGERTIPESYGDEGELALRPVEDTFDRSAKPTPGTNPIVQLPPIWDTSLPNGVRLLAVPNEETPTVTINAVFTMGQRDEPAGKAGLAQLTAAMMGEATRNKTAAEASEDLERIGAFFNIGSGAYTSTASLNVLSKHLDRGIELMMERLLEPAFLEEDFNRLKSQTIEGLLANRKTASGLAGRAVGAVAYGPDHPLSFPAGGLPATVENITLEDVKAFYAAHMPVHLEGITASTSLAQEELLTSLQPLAGLHVEEALREPLPDQISPTGKTLYLVNKEGAAQSSLRTTHPAPKYDALGEQYLAGLANFVLGGTFNSRVNLNLREDKGYTYGARTSFIGGPEYGRFSFSSEINKEATSAALTEVLTELETYDESGMDEADYDYMRSAIGQRDALRYETPGAKLGLLNNVLRYDLPLDYRTQQARLLQETDRETLNSLASKLIDPQNMSIVVVGDEAAIREELEALEIPVVKLDEDGYEVSE